MKKIVIINTGGTISMSQDQDSKAVSPNLVNPLHYYLSMFESMAQITILDPFNIPSPHIRLSHMLELKEMIGQLQENYDGIVITHGTDTLEETAYFLDLTVQQKVPIVLTGAMRSSNEIGADGLANLQSAIVVALDEESSQHGVVVVLNEEVHAAAYVTKTHTTNLATFQTPTFGPMGILSKNKVRYFQSFHRQAPIPIKSLEKRVGLIKAYADMSEDVIAPYLNYDGLVIEGLGVGNMPPATVSMIEQLIDKGIYVVMVSRAFNGMTTDIYDYLGGGAQLRRRGVIFSQGISGLKARLKLLVLLNAKENLNIKEKFEA